MLLFPFILTGCKTAIRTLQVVHQSHKIQLSQQYIPVLKGVDNQVLELTIEQTSPFKLNEMQIGIKGNESIEGILIHQLLGEEDQEEKIPLAAMGEIKAVNYSPFGKNLTETLIAVYDVRRNASTHLQGDIDVGMNRSTDRGKAWEPMKIIMDMGEWGGKLAQENGIGNPAILVDHHTNTIWVVA